MKRFLIALFATGIVMSASASGPHPKVAANMNFSSPHVRVVRVIPAYHFYRPYYSYGISYGYYPLGYNPLYSPYAYRTRPTELDLKVEEINNDYQHRIATVRHDKSISRAERKQEIRDLRHERNDAIINAKNDYYNRQNN